MPRKMRNEVEWIMNVWSIGSQMLNCSKTEFVWSKHRRLDNFTLLQKRRRFVYFEVNTSEILFFYLSMVDFSMELIFLFLFFSVPHLLCLK